VERNEENVRNGELIQVLTLEELNPRLTQLREGLVEMRGYL
jgi:hypothetical protein